MTALTRWNPFEEMEAMQNRLSSFFDWAPVRNGHQNLRQQQWSPRIDVVENSEEYLIRADLPGVGKEEVSVTLEGNELMLKGERPSEPLDEGAHYLYQERAYGTFIRTFQLPSDADPSGIAAEFKNGLLTVRVAKLEKAKPRSIAIKSE